MEFGNVANARIERRSVALRERRLGESRQRLTFSKYWSVGFLRQSMRTTLWFIGSLAVLVPFLAACHIDAGTASAPATEIVKWIDGGPNNRDLRLVADQVPPHTDPILTRAYLAHPLAPAK